MHTSTRNHSRAIVVEVKKGTVTSHVRVDISANILTSSIANEALDDLGIKVDDCVSLAISIAVFLRSLLQTTWLSQLVFFQRSS